MSLIEKIKHNQLAARKAHQSNIATLLTTVIGEAEMAGKNAGNRAPTDDEVISVIGKFIKNIDDTLKVLDPASVESEIYRQEKNILVPYMPEKLSDSKLEAIIASIIDEVGKDKGKVMQALKAGYNGRYDGKLAAQMVQFKL